MRVPLAPWIAGTVWAAILLQPAVPHPARAVEAEDGAAVLGVSAGLGKVQAGASDRLGAPSFLGGQALYFPKGEWGMGLLVDRAEFQDKGSGQADVRSILFVERWNVKNRSEIYLPYFLAGVGYSESQADIAAGGTDRGSGPGFCAGLGTERFLGKRLSLAGEVRYQRAAASLPRMGLSGTTVVHLGLRLNLWISPEEDPFPK